MNRSRLGKSRSVQLAEMFRWMNISPQLRWNMRSENGPCSRVTWLWYSSAGLLLRDPYSSSRANGLKTDDSRTRARVPFGCMLPPYLIPYAVARGGPVPRSAPGGRAGGAPGQLCRLSRHDRTARMRNCGTTELLRACDMAATQGSAGVRWLGSALLNRDASTARA